ncbi:unnamed protein product [Soboliphyme baturini]|uniref:C-type lectin domain-containing protein n=1 Tax=Soboliphyme baturini TaxID=241478 RepID=A0A183I9D4_9BILA|nr:unnamed protein product [Soboliphyme baturini]
MKYFALTFAITGNFSCPIGANFFKDRCYEIVLPADQTSLKTWSEARRYCLMKGGDLVAPLDAPLYNYFVSRLQKVEVDLNTTQFWIGLRKREGRYFTSPVPVWVNDKTFSQRQPENDSYLRLNRDILRLFDSRKFRQEKERNFSILKFNVDNLEPLYHSALVTRTKRKSTGRLVTYGFT